MNDSDREVLKVLIEERTRYLETLIAANDRRMEAIQMAAKEALTKAETATQLRFEGFNEFNERISELTRTFVDAKVFAEYRNSVERDLGPLKDLRSKAVVVFGAVALFAAAAGAAIVKALG